MCVCWGGSKDNPLRLQTIKTYSKLYSLAHLVNESYYLKNSQKTTYQAHRRKLTTLQWLANVRVTVSFTTWSKQAYITYIAINVDSLSVLQYYSAGVLLLLCSEVVHNETANFELTGAISLNKHHHKLFQRRKCKEKKNRPNLHNFTPTKHPCQSYGHFQIILQSSY